MKTKTITFEFTKATRNTLMFTETPAEGQPPVVGSLYLQKWFVGQSAGPGTIVKVTLEVSGALSPASTQTAAQLLA